MRCAAMRSSRAAQWAATSSAPRGPGAVYSRADLRQRHIEPSQQRHQPGCGQLVRAIPAIAAVGRDVGGRQQPQPLVQPQRLRRQSRTPREDADTQQCLGRYVARVRIVRPYHARVPSPPHRATTARLPAGYGLPLGQSQARASARRATPVRRTVPCWAGSAVGDGEEPKREQRRRRAPRRCSSASYRR